MGNKEEWLALWYEDGHVVHRSWPHPSMSTTPTNYVKHCASCPRCVAVGLLSGLVFMEAAAPDGSFRSAVRLGVPEVISTPEAFTAALVRFKAARWAAQHDAPMTAGLAYAQGRLEYYRALPKGEVDKLLKESVTDGKIQFS